MYNFPGNWFDFTVHKEIKRIRKDINNTMSLRVEIAVSIVIAVLSFFLGEYVNGLSTFWEVLIYVGITILIIGIFALPKILMMISIKKHCNIIIDGKDAVSIFDDEIVYDVLVASEYVNLKNVMMDGQKDLKDFYLIEIKYYLSKAIDQLLLFNSNYTQIFGNGKNRISNERFQNISQLIYSIIKNESISIDEKQLNKFASFYKCVIGKDL